MAFIVKEATISCIHDAVRNGQLTFRTLAEMYLKRIDAYDKKGPSLNSVILVNPQALEIADEKDRQFKENGLLEPLHGIPVLLKDNVGTKDMFTTGGSLSLEGFTPEKDAFITRKFLEAGAIILAKVNTHEFALSGETVSSNLGQTLNPYDLSRTPGGSSGGTGAGIAASFGTVGIGTDTINSIRSPASACNLVGFRPTLGLVSRTGIIPYALTHDTAGPIARTVEDAVRVLEVISGYDPDDSGTAWATNNIPTSYQTFLKRDSLGGARLGVLRSFFGQGPEHEEVNKVTEQCLDVMRERGAVLLEIEEIFDVDEIIAKISVHFHELERDLDSYLNGLGDRASVHSVADVLASGKYVKTPRSNLFNAQAVSEDIAEYKDRLIKRLELQTRVMKVMADHALDALVFPHQKQLVCHVGGSQLERNGALGSVTGFPAIVVPGGFSTPNSDAPLGVPVGLEFFGRPWSEPTLIQLACSFEKATRHRKSPSSTP